MESTFKKDVVSNFYSVLSQEKSIEGTPLKIPSDLSSNGSSTNPQDFEEYSQNIS